MRKRKNKVADEAEIDMTPMLDIVFIMLIFFIVTASFLKEAGIDVNRPESITQQESDNASILIAVSDNNEIWVDKRRIDIRAVRANIERLRAENPEGAVVLQADKNSKSGIVLEVLDAIRSAGVYDAVVSTREK
jgi:biopolymer transport protein ExbD